MRRRLQVAQRAASWVQELRLATGACGLIDAVGAPLLRLLAERSGLRAGLSGALGAQRPDFVPGHDRGQVLVNVAVALGLAARSVAGAVHTLQACLAALLQAAIAALRAEGVQVLLGPGDFEPHPPGDGGPRIAMFPWVRALAEAATAAGSRAPASQPSL